MLQNCTNQNSMIWGSRDGSVIKGYAHKQKQHGFDIKQMTTQQNQTESLLVKLVIYNQLMCVKGANNVHLTKGRSF